MSLKLRAVANEVEAIQKEGINTTIRFNTCDLSDKALELPLSNKHATYLLPNYTNNFESITMSFVIIKMKAQAAGNQHAEIC